MKILKTFIGRFVLSNGWRFNLIVGLSILIGILWLATYMHGRQSVFQKQTEQALKAWEKRNEIENNTNRLNDADLCREFGGLPDDCANKLRGLDETTKTE